MVQDPLPGVLQSYKFLYYKLIDLSCSVIASATKLTQEYGILAAKPVGMLKGTATVVDSLNGGRSATEIVWLFRPSMLLFHSEFLSNIDNCACWMSQAVAESLIFNVFFPFYRLPILYFQILVYESRAIYLYSRSPTNPLLLLFSIIFEPRS